MTPINFSQLFYILPLISLFKLSLADGTDSADTQEHVGHSIEGRVDILTAKDKDWLPQTRILVDGGEHIGFLRGDGSFSIAGLSSGSYVVEVTNPTYLFEPARIDINSKGKLRARKVNHLQPSLIKVISYPLEFRERGKASYFQVREQWKITDFLFNPMVLTMVLPLLLIMVLPKMMNAADPDTQKEMQNQMSALQGNKMPDFSASEFLSNLFGSGAPSKPQIKSKSSKRK